MEYEMGESSPSIIISTLSKRLGIKNTIQTNFGDDYVFQIASSQESSSLAVSLSSNVIKLYSAATGHYLGELKGHSNSIHEMSFSVPSAVGVVCSCSSDGTIRTWDSRTFKQVSVLRASSSQEIYSFCFGGSSSNIVAAGCNAQIIFWDWRNGKQLACLEESHMDDVTQVQFVPGMQNKLMSSSIDGLICLHDIAGHIDDDDNLESVINVETSIAKFGLFGAGNQKLWCLTQIETLSIWDWKDARREMNFEDARTLASDRWNRDNIDYFVDCYYSNSGDRLWAIGGTNSGMLGYFPIDEGASMRMGQAEAILEGGHTGVVRSVLHASGTCSGGGLFQSEGGRAFGWTGGEDGRLCCWSLDKTAEANRSWVSNNLIMKPKKKHHILCRHQPY